MKLGRMETAVLNAIHDLADSGEEAYGVSIRRRLERYGNNASICAVYVAIGQLRDAGLIQTREVPGGEERGYLAKLLCTPTPEARGQEGTPDA